MPYGRYWHSVSFDLRGQNATIMAYQCHIWQILAMDMADIGTVFPSQRSKCNNYGLSKDKNKCYADSKGKGLETAQVTNVLPLGILTHACCIAQVLIAIYCKPCKDRLEESGGNCSKHWQS